MTSLASLKDDVPVCILVKDAHQVLDIKPLSGVVKQFLEILVVKLLSVKLFATEFVYNVAVSALDKPAKAIHASAFLVHVEVLPCLQQLRDGATCALVILELKVTHKVVRVEVELLDAEGGRHFSFFVHLACRKHLLLGVVFEHIARFWVGQVAANIGRVSSLVSVVALTILENDDVATVISI